MNSSVFVQICITKVYYFTTDRGFKIIIVVLSFLQAPIQKIDPKFKYAKRRGSTLAFSFGKPQFR